MQQPIVQCARKSTKMDLAALHYGAPFATTTQHSGALALFHRLVLLAFKTLQLNTQRSQ